MNVGDTIKSNQIKSNQFIYEYEHEHEHEHEKSHDSNELSGTFRPEAHASHIVISVSCTGNIVVYHISSNTVIGVWGTSK